MNKSTKIVIGIFIAVVVIWGIVFGIDYYAETNISQNHSQNKIEDNSNIDVSNQFRAIVLSCNEKTLIVKPLEEKDTKVFSDKVSIGLGNNNDMIYMEGQELLITYTGDVMDTYGAQIKTTKIQTETEYKTKIEDLPKDYNIIDAIKDNCVVSIHNKKLYNKDELDRFVENVNNNRTDFMRCISFTIEGNMLITDVNFEGSNSFRVTFDWTRDEWSSSEDRTYKYCRYKTFGKEDTENGVSYYVDSRVEGQLDKMYITGYENDTEIVNNYECNYLLNVKSTHKDLIKEITAEEKLSTIYDYNIYYYGFDNCTIQIGNEEIDLEQALIENRVTMEQIIEQAEKDSEAGIIDSDMYKEGGSMIYFYDTYTIIKSHSLDGNKDVYIGIPEMRLNMVR